MDPSDFVADVGEDHPFVGLEKREGVSGGSAGGQEGVRRESANSSSSLPNSAPRNNSGRTPGTSLRLGGRTPRLSEPDSLSELDDAAPSPSTGTGLGGRTPRMSAPPLTMLPEQDEQDDAAPSPSSPTGRTSTMSDPGTTGELLIKGMQSAVVKGKSPLNSQHQSGTDGSVSVSLRVEGSFSSDSPSVKRAAGSGRLVRGIGSNNRAAGPEGSSNAWVPRVEGVVDAEALLSPVQGPSSTGGGFGISGTTAQVSLRAERSREMSGRASGGGGKKTTEERTKEPIREAVE
eukprot:166626-Prorocentrum_minimum.AAC.2